MGTLFLTKPGLAVYTYPLPMAHLFILILHSMLWLEAAKSPTIVGVLTQSEQCHNYPDFTNRRLELLTLNRWSRPVHNHFGVSISLSCEPIAHDHQPCLKFVGFPSNKNRCTTYRTLNIGQAVTTWNVYVGLIGTEIIQVSLKDIT